MLVLRYDELTANEKSIRVVSDFESEIVGELGKVSPRLDSIRKMRFVA